MDNLFELIILLVFILSGINSLFGNKKKRREKIERPEESVRQKKRFPQDETDILEEIFGVKKEKAKSPDPFEEPSVQKYEYKQPEYNYDYENTWNPEDEFKHNTELKPSDVTAREKIFDEIAKIDYDKLVTAKKQQSLLSHIDHQIKPQVNKKVIELRKKLKDKKSIKDSIIIAEILSKPKALRFRGNDLLR